MLSVRVFTPLPDVRKPKTSVLTFWTLVPESFGNFWKHLYITAGSFGSGGGGKVFISASGAVGEGCDPTVIPTFRTIAMFCGDSLYTKTVMVQPPSQIDTGPAASPASPAPPPPNPRALEGQATERSELIYKIYGQTLETSQHEPFNHNNWAHFYST
jgi:hypothetical protein